MPGKDYYAILGVSRNASDKEIRQAYRRLARRHHPDVNPGDKAAETRFKEINQAYEVLSEPEKRRKYDLYGENWQQAERFQQARRRAGEQWSEQGAPFDLGGDLGSVFGNLFRGFGRRGAVAEYPVEVSLEEAYRGANRLVEAQAEERCSTCDGSGRLAGAVCHVCRGRGLSHQPRRLEVKIPAGVQDGSRVRVAAGPGQELYLRVSVRPHARYERKGDDLHTELAVPLMDAVLGGEAELPTVAEKAVALKIPPLTQNGRVFRLAGLGMPRLSGSGRGDLYARVKVLLPERLTERERQLFEELQALRKVSTR